MDVETLTITHTSPADPNLGTQRYWQFRAGLEERVRVLEAAKLRSIQKTQDQNGQATYGA
jgi:hypothetical protein